LRLAQLVVDRGWTHAAAAKMFMVAPRTAKKWADRYRVEGQAGMADRSSRPHTCANKTSPALVRQIVRLRWRQRLGPVQIADRLGMQASTVHAVLVRCRINRLSHIDRVTGEPLRRYEHDYPGSLIHVDVTKSATSPAAADTVSSDASKAESTNVRPWRAPGRGLQTQNRHRVPAYGHRRPLPRRLRRNPRRREGRDGRRRAAPAGYWFAEHGRRW
jgi:hypothetical protein